MKPDYYWVASPRHSQQPLTRPTQPHSHPKQPNRHPRQTASHECRYDHQDRFTHNSLLSHFYPYGGTTPYFPAKTQCFSKRGGSYSTN